MSIDWTTYWDSTSELKDTYRDWEGMADVSQLVEGTQLAAKIFEMTPMQRDILLNLAAEQVDQSDTFPTHDELMAMAWVVVELTTTKLWKKSGINWEA